MKTFLFAIAVIVAAAVNLSAQKQRLTDQEQSEAIRIGTKQKGRLTGLSLIDSGRAFANALVASTNPTLDTDGNGFSLRIYTPTTWIQQLAADAAKQYRPFTVTDITEEMLEPVLRVVVYPDKPTKLTAGGMARSSSVEHVVLRDDAKRLVVQPVTKEPFTDTASSAFRDMAYEGIVAKFPLDGLSDLRGRGDREFLVVVIGNGTAERIFKVKQKHFERLP